MWTIHVSFNCSILCRLLSIALKCKRTNRPTTLYNNSHMLIIPAIDTYDVRGQLNNMNIMCVVDKPSRPYLIIIIGTNCVYNVFELRSMLGAHSRIVGCISKHHICNYIVWRRWMTTIYWGSHVSSIYARNNNNIEAAL